MARYDFECPYGHVVEHQFMMREVPERTECPSCGAQSKRKLNSFTLYNPVVQLPPSKRKKGLGGS